MPRVTKAMLIEENNDLRKQLFLLRNLNTHLKEMNKLLESVRPKTDSLQITLQRLAEATAEISRQRRY